MFETLVDRIFQSAETRPEKLALAFKNDRLSYADLKESVIRTAGRLAEAGVMRGDNVPFSATSKPEAVILYLAIQYLGAAAVFVDKNAGPGSAAAIYHDCGAKIFFTDKPLKGFEESCRTYSLRKVCTETGKDPVSYVRPEENDLAELIYTSGTTGMPKGCMLTYKSVYNIWMNTIRGIGMSEQDVILLPLPLNHSFALRVLRAALFLGASVILQNGFIFAQEIENNLDRYSCTGIAIVPASVETVSKQMQDRFPEIMGRFRYIEVGAGSLTPEQRRRLTGQLPETTIYNTWGSSESGGALFLNVTEAVKTGEKLYALGKPLDHIEVKTLDPAGNAFRSDKDHPGRMAIRGDMQMAGYWKKPELTAETLQNGWLITNDLVYSDGDGYFYMLGRVDDIINVGGEKVSPVEVENAAGEYEYISECACIGVPDPDKVMGWVPVLFFAAGGSGYSEKELRQFLAARLEKYKMPVQFIELPEIPRNAMKKIDRKALRKMWEQHETGNIPVNETVRMILTRRSIRRFKEVQIDGNILSQILKCGYHAPSGHNLQTWKFTVITNQEKLARLKAAAETAAKENDVHFYGWENPQVLILISNDERNPDGCQDASCAAENMMLAAWSFGIASTWLNPLKTLREKQPVKDILDEFGVPDNHVIWSAVAMGYPAADGLLLKKNANVINWIE